MADQNATGTRAAVTEAEYWALVKLGRYRRDPNWHMRFAREDHKWSWAVLARA